MTWRPRRGFRVGAMRERIDVQTATVDASSGQPVRTWATTYASEPAAFDPVAGGETIRGRQVEAGTTAVFTVHSRSGGFDTEMRVIHNAQTYGVVRAVPVEGGRRYVELHCKSIPNPSIASYVL